jgi:hypothetical protein
VKYHPESLSRSVRLDRQSLPGLNGSRVDG